MRFGLCTDVDNIEVAQRLGFAYIECYAAGLASMTEEEFERAKAAAEQSSIHVECFNGLFPGDFSLLGARDDDRLRRYLDALFARVEAFRAPLVVFGSGKARSCPEGMDFAEGCRQLAEITQIMGEVAEPHGNHHCHRTPESKRDQYDYVCGGGGDAGCVDPSPQCEGVGGRFPHV